MQKRNVYLVVDVEGNLRGVFDNPHAALRLKFKIEKAMAKKKISFDKNTIWVKTTKLHSNIKNASYVRRISLFK